MKILMNQVYICTDVDGREQFFVASAENDFPSKSKIPGASAFFMDILPDEYYLGLPERVDRKFAIGERIFSVWKNKGKSETEGPFIVREFYDVSQVTLAFIESEYQAKHGSRIRFVEDSGLEGMVIERSDVSYEEFLLTFLRGKIIPRKSVWYDKFKRVY